MKKEMVVLIFLLIPVLILMRTKGKVPVNEYNKRQICDAIYIIEGGEKTKYPYGIMSVHCKGEEECRKICYNTVLNNKTRYKNYGYKSYATYLEFLASRYCPESENLCENWLPNLKYYLEKR